ncbi:MAG: hypothetical protein ACE5OZ_10790 [Candidatus Heimdallarchaeota archaeon]
MSELPHAKAPRLPASPTRLVPVGDSGLGLHRHHSVPFRTPGRYLSIPPKGRIDLDKGDVVKWLFGPTSSFSGEVRLRPIMGNPKNRFTELSERLRLATLAWTDYHWFCKPTPLTITSFVSSFSLKGFPTPL